MTYKKLSGHEDHPQKGNTRYGGWAKTLLRILGCTPLSWIANAASANIYEKTSSNTMLIWETQAKHGALYVVGKHKPKTSSKHMILHITTSCTAKIQKPGVRYNHIGKLESESTTLTPTLGKPTPKQSMLADIWDPGRPLTAQISTNA